MLIFGDIYTLNDLYCMGELNDYKVYNLSSLFEGCQRLNLIPSNLVEIDVMNDETFDSVYFNYIFSNDQIFINFMKIIDTLYLGYNVYILISKGESFDRVTEVIMKIIQERYGYKSYLLNEPDDYDKEAIYTQEEFSLNGISFLQQDRERLFSIIGSNNIKNYWSDLNV